MKTSEKLQKRLNEELGLNVELPERVRRGRHGKAAGTWAWSANYTASRVSVGSEDTMLQCANAEKLTKHRDNTGALIINAE